MTLTDEQEPYQPKERLEAVFPNILEVRMDNSRTRQEWMQEEVQPAADPEEMFAGFFLQMQGREMDEEEQQILREVFSHVREGQDL